MFRLRSFSYLNLTQFFSALNDNIYKLLLIYQLIHLQGVVKSNTILSLAGAIFVIPFILFASFAGTLADRYSKRSIILYTRLFEIITLSLGVVAFATKSVIGSYTILFLMATHSALFSPSKYGIVPEIVPEEKISRCNGILTGTTYLAIIIGTFLASFLADVTNKNYVYASLFCVLIALIGAITSFGIHKTFPQSPNKKLSLRFVSEVLHTLKKAKRQRYLLLAIVSGAYFLFLGAYVQLNIIPLSIQSLGFSEIQGGYLFLMTAIGIGIGSVLAGKCSGNQVEIGFAPFAAIGITLALCLIYQFASSFVVVVPLLVFLGFMGGFYIVPLESFIQIASVKEDRGQNVAAANFINFIGVILAAGFLALFGNVLEFSAAEGFLSVGILTLFIAFILSLMMADQLFRLIVSIMARFFWKFTIEGKQSFDAHSKTLILCQRTSWLDTLIVMSVLPRMIRYIVPAPSETLRGRKFIYKILRLIPVDSDLYMREESAAINEAMNELSLGHSVCALLPTLENPYAKKWRELIGDSSGSITLISIKRSIQKEKSSRIGELFSLFHQQITIVLEGKDRC